MQTLHDQRHITVDVFGQKLIHFEDLLPARRIKAATIVAYMDLKIGPMVSQALLHIDIIRLCFTGLLR
jgi:hypothetical protein